MVDNLSKWFERDYMGDYIGISIYIYVYMYMYIYIYISWYIVISKGISGS